MLGEGEPACGHNDRAGERLQQTRASGEAIHLSSTITQLVHRVERVLLPVPCRSLTLFTLVMFCPVFD